MKYEKGTLLYLTQRRGWEWIIEIIDDDETAVARYTDVSTKSGFLFKMNGTPFIEFQGTPHPFRETTKYVEAITIRKLTPEEEAIITAARL